MGSEDGKKRGSTNLYTEEEEDTKFLMEFLKTNLDIEDHTDRQKSLIGSSEIFRFYSAGNCTGPR